MDIAKGVATVYAFQRAFVLQKDGVILVEELIDLILVDEGTASVPRAFDPLRYSLDPLEIFFDDPHPIWDVHLPFVWLGEDCIRAWWFILAEVSYDAENIGHLWFQGCWIDTMKLPLNLQGCLAAFEPRPSSQHWFLWIVGADGCIGLQSPKAGESSLH